MSSEDEIFSISIGSKILTIQNHEITLEGKLFRNSISKPTELIYYTSRREIDLFSVGKNYHISLRDSTKNRLDISVGYYLGIRKDVKYNLYNQVLDNIWTRFFDPSILDLIDQIDNGDNVKMGKLQINKFSVSELGGDERIKKRILIEDLKVSKYWDQIVLSSQRNPMEYISLKYEWDWNISVAEILIDYLYK